MSVRFEDPPERKERRQRRWAPLVAELLPHRGEWAILTTLRDAYQAQNAVRSLRSRKVKYPDGAFSFMADGSKVYGRYDG